MTLEDVLQLNAPQSYLHATDAAKALVCNGAGPKGWGWAVPDTIYGLSIKPAADIHDWSYMTAKTDGERLKADLMFLQNMFVLILQRDRATGWLGRRLLVPRLIRAILYFTAVWRLGGQFAKT